MSITTVTNESQLQGWMGSGDLQIVSGFNISLTFIPINITTNGVINIYGNNNTLTVETAIGTWNGLFKVQDGSTCTINCTGINLKFNGPTLINEYKGGLFEEADGSMAYNLTISLCSVEGNSFSLGRLSGGICGYGIYATITNCYCKGGNMTADYGGYICGGYYMGPYISNCFSTGDISNSGGGIVGYSIVDLTIVNCYSLGNIDQSAGIIHTIDSGVFKIYNCYSTGNIINGGAGIVYLTDSGTVTLKNCYSLGTLTNSYGLIYQIKNCNVVNCYSLGAIGTSAGTNECFGSDLGSNNILSIGSGSGGSWNGNTILSNNYLINDFTDGSTTYSNIWSSSNGTSPPPSSYTEPFLLTVFTTYPWSHTGYNSSESFDFTIVCIVKGASILTDKGYINIENLKINDKISTNEGYKSVFKIGTGYLDINNAKEELLKAKKGFYLTLRHSFLIPDDENLDQYLNVIYHKKIINVTSSYKIPGYHKIPAIYCYPSLCDVIDENELLLYNNGDMRIQYFHVVIRDTNKRKNFGMYINETLVETLSIEDYNEGKIY